MKKLLITVGLATFFGINLHSQTKKDGSLDMRYKANNEAYGSSSSSSISY